MKDYRKSLSYYPQLWQAAHSLAALAHHERVLTAYFELI